MTVETDSIFGQILGADIMQDVVIAHLKKWLRTYLAEVDEQRELERGYTSAPKSWQVVPVFDGTLDQQLPAMLVICPGTSEPPKKDGKGYYRAKYTVGVAALVAGPDQIAANDIAKRFGAAITACVLQKKGQLNPNVEGVTWEGDAYDDVPNQADRTLSSCTVHFTIEYKDVLTDHGGPAITIVTPDPNENPKPDPTEAYPPWGKIPDEEHIQVTLVPRKGDE